MTLQQLTCFVSVARNRSFARAAEEMHISQPAVTHHIRTLEDELNAKLLDRTRHRVLLTPTGEHFLLEISDILNQLDRAVSTIQGTEELPQILHIGFENTVELYKLSRVFAAYHALCPHVRIYCHGVNLQEATAMFNANKLDLLISTCSTINSADEKFLPLFSSFFCCLMRRDDPLAEKNAVTDADMQNRTLIFSETQFCAPDMAEIQRRLHHLYPHLKIHFSTSAAYTAHMVEGGIGIAIMPDFLVPRGVLASAPLCRVRFGTNDTAQFGVLYHPSLRAEKTDTFLRLIKQAYSDENDCPAGRKKKK